MPKIDLDVLEGIRAALNAASLSVTSIAEANGAYDAKQAAVDAKQSELSDAKTALSQSDKTITEATDKFKESVQQLAEVAAGL